MKNQQVIEKIETLFMQQRRSPGKDRILCSNNCQHCLAAHSGKIRAFVERNEPVEFVLPAFPAKSANHEKTLGARADKAEELALIRLNQLCKNIKKFYAPGAKIWICSDGRVFSDCVGVTDEDVEQYIQDCRDFLTKNDCQHIEFFRLDDVYHNVTYPKMRAQLKTQYAQPEALLKNDIKKNDLMKHLFNGIHRFVFEDLMAGLKRHHRHSQPVSKNQLKKQSKQTAISVIQRSQAWSQCVAEQFPDAIRLSIHPQPCGSEKMSIRLLDGKQSWATPWHNVLVKIGESSVLMKKKFADYLPTTLIYENNRPSYYQVENDNEDIRQQCISYASL